MTYHKLPYIKL